jgi:SAM-dependent methyltransferase
MSGFSAQWLALREAADHRSRNTTLADKLKTRFLQREQIRVVDLGCGTGSNLRATAALLPDRQEWTLVDHDPALLQAAKAALAAWADTATPKAAGLRLVKGAAHIDVDFRQADLVAGLDAILEPAPDLVTASALFDLASPSFIERFAAAVARRRAVFYTVLTFNGIQHWTPRSPIDQAMTAAFCRHQMTDKGFGVSAGPTAPVALSDAFSSQGYGVEEGVSPWRLGPGDASLVAELAAGFAAAVRETRSFSNKEIDGWLARARTGAEVGHTDTLAIPGLGGLDMGRDD